MRGITGGINDGVLSDFELKELNDRQTLCAELIANHFDNPQNSNHPAAAMPTGFGKGRVIARLIDSTEHKKILLIVGTKNILLNQSFSVFGGFNWQILREIVDNEVGEGYSFGILPDTSNDVTICTWQGLGAYMRRKSEPEQFGLVIVDEVHNAGTEARLDLLERLDAIHNIGLTATPYRSSGKYRSPEEYGFDIVDSMSLPECIRKRWLTPLLGKPIDMGVVLPAEVRTGEELNRKVLYKALRKHPELFKTIAKKTIPYIQDGKKTIIAVNRVKEEACVIAKELERAGIKVGLAVNQSAAKQLSGEFVTLDAIERYGLPRNDPNSVQVLISPQVIGEGFDHPATECIVWAAPTLSALRYTQVMGRGARRCQGKRVCFILDFVYMIENYGYSMNFAQFFRYDDLVELEGGYFYLGSDLSGLADLVAKTSSFDKPISAGALATIEASGEWKTTNEIACILNYSPVTVQKAADDLNLKTEKRRILSGQIHDCYSPESIELIKKELVVPEAGEWKTVGEIGNLLGYSRKTIKRAVDRLNSKSERRRVSSGWICDCYSPEDMALIREELYILNVPETGGWKSATEIAHQLKSSSLFIVKVAKKLNLKSEKRRATNGNIRDYYALESVELIRRELEAPEAGEWKTVGQITRLLNCSDGAFYGAVSKLKLQSEKRIATTRRRRIYDHYSPESIELIRKELEAPEAGEWKTVRQIAGLLSSSPSKINKTINKLGLESKQRRVTGGQLRDCYSPESVELIRQTVQK